MNLTIASDCSDDLVCQFYDWSGHCYGISPCSQSPAAIIGPPIGSNFVVLRRPYSRRDFENCSLLRMDTLEHCCSNDLFEIYNGVLRIMSEKDPYAAKKKIENSENQTKQQDWSKNDTVNKESPEDSSSGSSRSQGGFSPQQDSWSSRESSSQGSSQGTQNTRDSGKTNKDNHNRDDQSKAI